MKKKNIFKFILIILAIIITMPVKTYGHEKELNTKKVILIDPGHGGFDGGAVSKRGTIEKDINLSISRKINNKLKDKKYLVHMTRDEDISLHTNGKSIKEKKVQDLSKRCKLKIETNCDIFISVHQNIYNKSSLFGAQVWYASNEKSQKFADILQKHLKEEVDSKNKRLSKAAGDNYRILRDKYDAPCVILECGFLSNPNEETKLKDENYQEKLAEAVANAVDEYFTENKIEE